MERYKSREQKSRDSQGAKEREERIFKFPDMHAGKGYIVTKLFCILHMDLFSISQLTFEFIAHELLF